MLVIISLFLFACDKRYTFEDVIEKDHMGNELKATYKYDHWTGRKYVNYGGGWRLLNN